MTIPQNVADAVGAADAAYGLYSSGFSGHRHWQTIRTHLLSQESEIDRLRESTHYANGVADLAMKHRDLAESRLAAANALLWEVYAYIDMFAPNSELYDEVEAHLQGAGDEAVPTDRRTPERPE